MKNMKRIHKVVIKQMYDESPDTSYLEQEGWEDRFQQYQDDQFSFIGIRAEAEYSAVYGRKDPENSAMWTGGMGPIQKVSSGGLWGIESDSSPEYIKEVEADELSSLKSELKAIGFSSRAIATAFKNIERKEL